MPPPRKKKSLPASSHPALSDNLETTGDHLKTYSLQSLLTNKRSPETRHTARLGDVLIPWFEQVVTKPAEKLGPLTQLCQALIPEKILQRSRILSFQKGTLSIALDSAPLRAQLDAQLRAGLLRKLQIESRGVIYKVKTSVQTPIP